jgi:hypothetical protein
LAEQNLNPLRTKALDVVVGSWAPLDTVGDAGDATGYLHAAYAASLAEFGTPRLLPRSGGWILERRIPGRDDHDAMGCYPMFACRDWTQLPLDLAELGRDLVSLVVVSDPFGAYTSADLHRAFPDQVALFKQHFVADLDRISPAMIKKHHRHYARRALARVEVELCPDPAAFLDEWVELYTTLIVRHNLEGIQAFSRAAFARQLCVPGIVVLRATERGRTVAAHLWYVQGNVAHSHLAAASERGYGLMAAYALYWCALAYFRGKVRWLALGAGAGTQREDADGLSRFKRGWATDTRNAYLCARICDRERYAALAAERKTSLGRYFPAYRQGEFE